MTYYSHENGFVFNAAESVSRTLSGTVKLFFGGRFSYFIETNNLFTTVLAAVDVLAFAVFVVLLLRSLRKRLSGEIPYESRVEFGGVTVLCLTWVCSYMVFLFFWIPKNTFYRMFYLAPLMILIGMWVWRIKFVRPHAAIAPLFVTVVILSNFLFLIYPYSLVRAETPLSMATGMNKVWSPKSVVYYSVMDSDSDLIRYFSPATKWKPLGTIDPTAFEVELQQIYAAGGDAWVEHSAYDGLAKREDIAAWFAASTSGQPTFRVKDPAYNVVFIKIVPAGF
jgi:hypothetical protein